MSDKTPDDESNRLGRRMKRYAQVGAGVGGIAAKVAGQRMFGLTPNNDKTARELKAALGGLKGPIMKVAQMLATVPDIVPPEFAAELSELQSAAPAMGWPFVKRRMRAELGAGWEARFKSFEHNAAAAASLGQVHRATGLDGRALAAKLQYPDMQSAVDADLNQLGLIFSIHRRLDQTIDTREIYAEIRARLVEELDYAREAAHTRLYADIFAKENRIAVPEIVEALSTKRLLTMTWLDGKPLLSFRDRTLKERNAIAEAMFTAWWFPFSHYGVIHGDPHLGNYTVRETLGINLLDYGCIRVFPAAFVEGVVELYRALETQDRDRAAAAYKRWGFTRLTNELIDVLNVWARFHLCADARQPRALHRRRHQSGGIWPQGSLPGASGARQAWAGDAAARIRVHGPRRHRPWRRLPASRRGTEFPQALQRDHRRLRRRQACPASGACAKEGGRAEAGMTLFSNRAFP